ncbi:tRNA (N(6)-L-threonylcarbamoyladenosine(37)-C(2))-methylthiotransferase [Candidatus Woesearchaeota archaeon]|nr:tRNA (N(6)-L-threonylcarbamoyladenosine(37)-C(2))-methylthiotransferase [Candidatus Woesearchaeota archaeon]
MKVFVTSEGCSANFAEGEIIKGILSEKHEIVDSVENADAAVINTCTVKGDYRSVKKIAQLHETNPKMKLVLSGCVTKEVINQIECICPTVSVVTTNNIDKIEDALRKKIILAEKTKLIKLSLPRKRDNSIVGIVPICQGCLDSCSYCSTKLSKGSLFSYPEQQIISECKRFIDDDCKELWITAQDTCCYGFDIGTNLSELLKKITALEGEFKIRVGMGNPRHVKKFLSEFIEAMQHPKIFRFVHIPVQAGSNSELKRMQRGHTAEDFVDLVSALRAKIPEITVSTDIIVGFPEETEEEFNASVELIKKIKPDVLNISRFAPRPGTKAALMPQINGRISKDRSRILTEVFQKIAEHNKQKWLGWQGTIVIDESGKNSTSVGRNKFYIPVVVENIYPLGTALEVEIADTAVHYLKGKVIKH